MTTPNPDTMPLLGQKGAPVKFTGHHDHVKKFIRHYKQICQAYGITDDAGKCSRIVDYCSSKVNKLIEALTSYQSNNWSQLEKDLLQYYDADFEGTRYTVKDLIALTKVWKTKQIKTLTRWKRYERKFTTIAGWLEAKSKITSDEKARYFWLGINKPLRSIIELRLITSSGTSPLSLTSPFSIDKVRKVAENLFERDRFDADFTDSDTEIPRQSRESDSDNSSDSSEGEADSDEEFLTQLKKKVKNLDKKALRKSLQKYLPDSDNEGVQRPSKRANSKKSVTKKTTADKAASIGHDEVESLIKQMGQLSLDDQKYGLLYYRAIKLDPDVALCIQPPRIKFNTSSQFKPQNKQSNSSNTSAVSARDGTTCYGCGLKGHNMQACYKIENLIQSGKIAKDANGRLVDQNGQVIRRISKENFLQALERQKAESSAPKSHYFALNSDLSDYYMSDADQETGVYALPAAQHFFNHGDEEYFVMPVERSHQKVSTTARKAVLDGVYPPPLTRAKGKENVQTTKTTLPVPTGPVKFGPASAQKSQFPMKATSPSDVIRQLPVPYPFDARTKRNIPPMDTDIQMKDGTKRPQKPSISKTTPEQDTTPAQAKTKGPLRQSEVSAKIGETQVVTQILNTPVTLSVREVLASSKELSDQLTEMLKRKNPKVSNAYIGETPNTSDNSVNAVHNVAMTRGQLIELQMECDQRPITAIIDTGSQLNVVSKEAWKNIIRRPMDVEKTLTMNDANGGKGLLKGLVSGVPLTCGGLTTYANLFVAEKPPFDLLLGRPWQRSNYVSIDERDDGTYLIFRNPTNKEKKYELMVSADKSNIDYSNWATQTRGVLYPADGSMCSVDCSYVCAMLTAETSQENNIATQRNIPEGHLQSTSMKQINLTASYTQNNISRSPKHDLWPMGMKRGKPNAMKNQDNIPEHTMMPTNSNAIEMACPDTQIINPRCPSGKSMSIDSDKIENLGRKCMNNIPGEFPLALPMHGVSQTQFIGPGNNEIKQGIGSEATGINLSSDEVQESSDEIKPLTSVETLDISDEIDSTEMRCKLTEAKCPSCRPIKTDNKSQKITLTDNELEIIFKEGILALQRPQSTSTMAFQSLPPPPAHQLFLSNSVPLPPAHPEISAPDDITLFDSAIHHPFTHQLRTDRFTMTSLQCYRLEPKLDDQGNEYEHLMMLNTNLIAQGTNGLPAALRTGHAIIKFYPFTLPNQGNVVSHIPEIINQVQLPSSSDVRLSGESAEPLLPQYTFSTTQGIAPPLPDTVPHLVNRPELPSNITSPANAFFGQNNIPGLERRYRIQETDAGNLKDDRVSGQSSRNNLFDDLPPQNLSQNTSVPLVASIFTADSEDDTDQLYVFHITPEIVLDEPSGSGTTLQSVDPQDLHIPLYPPLTTNQLGLVFPPDFDDRDVIRSNGVIFPPHQNGENGAGDVIELTPPPHPLLIQNHISSFPHSVPSMQGIENGQQNDVDMSQNIYRPISDGYALFNTSSPHTPAHMNTSSSSRLRTYYNASYGSQYTSIASSNSSTSSFASYSLSPMLHDPQALTPILSPSLSTTDSDTSLGSSQLVSWSPFRLSSFESSSGDLSPITSCNCDVCTLEAGPNTYFDSLYEKCEKLRENESRNEEMEDRSSEDNNDQSSCRLKTLASSSIDYKSPISLYSPGGSSTNNHSYKSTSPFPTLLPPPFPRAKDPEYHKTLLDEICDNAIVTDIILKIKPEHMVNICARIKNYEYRKYQLPSTTRRIWFYEISPIDALTYVAEIGEVRYPGEVQDPSGLGNEDFDAGIKESKFGYPILSLYVLKQPLSASQLWKDHQIEVPHRYCSLPSSIFTSIPYDSFVKLFHIADGTQPISSSSTLSNLVEVDDREEDLKYSIQDSAQVTQSLENLVQTIYKNLPQEPQIAFGSNLTPKDLDTATSKSASSWDKIESWDNDEIPMLHDISESEDSSDEEELWSGYTNRGSDIIEFYPRHSDSSMSSRGSCDEGSSGKTFKEAYTSISQTSPHSSYYPEVRLLNQLQDISSHCDTALHQYPIQVFSITASESTNQPDTQFVTRENVMKMILSGNYCPTDHDIYVTLLTVIRSCLKEGLYHILCTVTSYKWRDRIDNLASTDEIRKFFDQHWFSKTNPDFSHNHPIFQPVSPITTDVDDLNTFNQLLYPGERKLLEFSSSIFNDTGDTLLAETIQDILNLRFRHPQLVLDLLHQGKLNPPKRMPINMSIKTFDAPSQSTARLSTENILTSSGRNPKDVINIDEFREVMLFALKQIEQILLSPEWKTVIDEEIPKDSFTYRFLQGWFESDDDKWLPEPWPTWYRAVFMEDHISFLERAHEVFTYNRLSTALSVAVAQLLSLQNFSPRCLEFIFSYDKDCPPSQRAHAPRIQKKNLFLQN